jgi:hypothetical protein
MRQASTLSGNGQTKPRTKAEIESSPKRPRVLRVRPDGIPGKLKDLAQWVAWRFERRGGKWTKLPIDAKTGNAASSTDSSTWATFEQALAFYQDGKADGIGFVFSPDDPFCGVDLDDCRDPETKVIRPWAEKIVAGLASYAEVSPTGTGLELIVVGTLPPGGNRKGKVEMYDRRRYFTVTGCKIPDAPATVNERSKVLSRLHAKLFPPSLPISPSAKGQPSTKEPATLNDNEVIRRAKKAKNGAKFRRLWNGDITGYKSHSEAVAALCHLLAFWSRDQQQIDRLFRQSGLYRDHWRDKKWERLGNDTIQRALDATAQDHYRNTVPPGASGGMTTYCILDGVIVHDKSTPIGSVTVPLCNFAARIAEQTIVDDGVERSITLAIEGELVGGIRLPRAEIPAADFSSMKWIVPNWGTRAVVFAGNNTKDHLRAALQLLSNDVPTRTVFAHTGWREFNGRWIYLHAMGGIGANGPEPAVNVALPDALAGYALPSPDGTAAESIRASLRILDLAPDRITVPLLAAVYRAVLAPADFAVHVAGPTGAGKTELAALAQQHFGAALGARRLPGSWASTGNSLEGLAFAAKDALLVVDDFAPGGSLHDVARCHREADRLLRAQANQAGRGRCRPDGSVRSAKPPRGLILSTGEDVPRGQSLRARLFVLEMSPADIDWQALTRSQNDAASGQFALAMSGYVQWLSSRIGKIRDGLPAKTAAVRNALHKGDQHARTPGIVADLLVGLKYFLRYAEHVQAINAEERAALEDRCRRALLCAAAEQSAHVMSAEPASYFVRLLTAIIVSGRGHLAGLDGQAPPEKETVWGWRQISNGWESQGRRIGWVHSDDVYLEPDASYAAAQEMARDQGESLAVSPRTLWKRCRERGLLAGFDARRQRNTIRRVIAAATRDVLHFRAGTLYGHPKPSISDDIAKDQRKELDGPTDGQVDSKDHFQKNRPSEPSIKTGLSASTGRSGRSVVPIEGDHH